MNILVINVHSAANAGDAVLNAATIAQLRQAFPTAAFTLAMNDPESHRAEDGEKAVPSFTYWAKQQGREAGGWRLGRGLRAILASLLFALRHRFRPHSLPRGRQPWHTTLAAYAQADLIVSCAGNFLYSSGSIGLPFVLAIYTMAYALLLGKPLYMMPQTVGPLSRGRDRRLVRWIMRHMRLITVRDDVSQRLLQEKLGLPNVHLVPDIAFTFPAVPAALGRDLLTAYGIDLAADGPLLGVTAIDWGAQNQAFQQQAEYEAGMAAALRQFLAETGGCAILFAQVQGPKRADDDRIAAARIHAHLSSDRVTFIDRPVTPAELRAAYGQMDFFMGTRLHSNIFALCEGVPLVAIQYQYKTRGIMRMLGLEDWVLEIEKASPATLPNFLLNGWHQRATIKATLDAALPPIIEAAAAPSQLIAADFATLRQEPAHL